jgi:hypothetical protein
MSPLLPVSRPSLRDHSDPRPQVQQGELLKRTSPPRGRLPPPANLPRHPEGTRSTICGVSVTSFLPPLPSFLLPDSSVARDRLKEMEAKVLSPLLPCSPFPHLSQLKGSSNRREARESRPPPSESLPHEDDDWTPIDKHLAEEAKNSSRFVSQTSGVTALEEELRRAQRMPEPQSDPPPMGRRSMNPRDDLFRSGDDEEADEICDSDSEEIDWKPSSATAAASSSSSRPPQSPPRTSSTSPRDPAEDFQEQDSDFSLNIPTSGFGFATEEDLESDVEGGGGEGEGGEDDDEESIFLNPEMTPQEIKAMRLKRFGLNYQRSLSSQSPEKDSSTAALGFGSGQSTQRVHVGVALLDDSDDEEEDDEEEEGDVSWTEPSRFSPQKRNEGRVGTRAASSLSPHRHQRSQSQQQFVNSPSATAWMQSKR